MPTSLLLHNSEAIAGYQAFTGCQAIEWSDHAPSFFDTEFNVAGCFVVTLPVTTQVR